MYKYTISSKALQRGLQECNDMLRDMCGGEQLVEVYSLTWSCCPEMSELGYRVRNGAPEEAIERARRLHIRASYDNTMDVVPPERFDNMTYNLWQRSVRPLDAADMSLFEERRARFVKRFGGYCA